MNTTGMTKEKLLIVTIPNTLTFKHKGIIDFDNILKLYNATERLIKPQELAVKKRTDCLYNTESVEKAKEHSLVFLKQALQK